MVNDGPARPPPGCSPATRSRPHRCSGRSRCSPPARCGPSCSTRAAPTPAPGPRASRPRTPPPRRPPRCSAAAPSRSPSAPPGLIGEQLPRAALLGGRREAAAELADHRGGGHGRRHRRADHRHRTPSRRHADPAGWSVGGFAKGAGHDRAGDGHDARRCSPPTRSSTPPALDAALRRGRRAHVRPARRRRRHVHQRHRPAARLGRVRGRGRPRASSPRRVTAVCARAVPAAAGRRRGRHQARHGRRARRQREARRGGGRRTRRPGQPGEDRVLRLRPELGADRHGGRPFAAARSTRTARHHHQRRPAVRGRGGRRGSARPPTCPGEVTVEIDAAGSATGAAEILTTDLSHAYVEENSAYSS